jgi:hypothetical protein
VVLFWVRVDKCVAAWPEKLTRPVPGFGAASSSRGRNASAWVAQVAGVGANRRVTSRSSGRKQLRFPLALNRPCDLDVDIVERKVIHAAPMMSPHSRRQRLHSNFLTFGNDGTERLHLDEPVTEFDDGVSVLRRHAANGDVRPPKLPNSTRVDHSLLASSGVI